MDDLYRVQRWHDTDHGRDRGKPLRRSRFISPVLEEDQWVSSCWCCCELCDPDWNPGRFNPYWSRAQQAMKGLLVR
jgi:hypothetical protein